MKINIPRIRGLQEQLFFLAYTIYMVFSMLVNTFYYAYFPDTYKYIIVACVALLLVQELGTRRMAKSALTGIIVLYSVIILITLRAKGESQRSFICVFAFAAAARNIHFHKISQFTMIIVSVMMVFTISSALAGIIPNYLESSMNRNRYYLGYLYSLYGPAFLLNLVLLRVYDRGQKIRILEIALLLAICFWMFWMTNSRLSFYLSATALAIALINKIGKGIVYRLRVIPALLIPSYIVSFFISFLTALNYNPSVSWQHWLNYLFGGRLNLARASLVRYGFSLLGNGNIEWVGHGLNAFGEHSIEEYNYVDSLYLQFLLRYGLLFTVFFLIATTMMMVVCYRKRDYMLELVLAIIAYHGIIDNLVLYLHYNTFWLLMGAMLFGYFRKVKPLEKMRRRRKKDVVPRLGGPMPMEKE